MGNGNEHIENMGQDLLARLSQPNKPAEPTTFEEHRNEGSEQMWYDDEGSWSREVGPDVSGFDPDSPANKEQRRLVALQTAIAVGATADNIIDLASTINKWIREGIAEPDPPEGAPDGEGPSTGQAGTPARPIRDSPQA